MPERGVAASSCAMSRPRSENTPRMRRIRNSMLSSTEFSVASCRLSTWSSELQLHQNAVDAAGFGEFRGGCVDDNRRARFEPRLAIRRRHEDDGVADRGGFWHAGGRRIVGRGAAARRRPDRAGDVGHRAERGRTRFQCRLAPHDLVELLVELFLVEHLPAGGAVDLGAQLGDAILIGVLHLGLARDQPRQHVVAESKIGRGRSRPHPEPVTVPITIQNATGPNRTCLPAWTSV